MEPLNIKEDAKTRFRRLLRSNRTFKWLIYFKVSPPKKDDIGPCKIERTKVDYYLNFTGRFRTFETHARNDVKGFLWDILENYDDTRNLHYKRLVSHNQKMHLRPLRVNIPVRHFMLIHDFSPQQHQEDFLIVEYKHHVNELNNMNKTNYRITAKVNTPIRYFETFEDFVQNFPHSVETKTSNDISSKRKRQHQHTKTNENANSKKKKKSQPSVKEAPNHASPCETSI